jgi:hypothetical protein
MRNATSSRFYDPTIWIEYEFFFPMIYNLGICSVGTLKSNISFPFYHTIDDTGRCTVNSLTQGWYRLCHTIVRTVDYFLESFVYSFVLEYMNFNLLLFLGLKTCFIYFWSFVSRTKVGFSKSILTQNFHQTTRLRKPTVGSRHERPKIYKARF